MLNARNIYGVLLIMMIAPAVNAEPDSRAAIETSQAREAFSKGRVHKAKLLYHAVLDANINNREAYVGLVDILLYEQRLDDAKILVDVATSLFPSDHSILLQQAIVESGLDNKMQAKNAFDRALEVAPNDFKTVSLAIAFYKELADQSKVNELETQLMQLIKN